MGQNIKDMFRKQLLSLPNVHEVSDLGSRRRLGGSANVLARRWWQVDREEFEIKFKELVDKTFPDGKHLKVPVKYTTFAEKLDEILLRKYNSCKLFRDKYDPDQLEKNKEEYRWREENGWSAPKHASP